MEIPTAKRAREDQKGMRAGAIIPMQISSTLCGTLIVAILMLNAVSGPCQAFETEELNAALATIAPAPSDQALKQIPDPGRKLLALRSYLRIGSKIAERWSWTDAEISEFQGSAAQQALLAEIAAVNEHFKAANTGYSLYVHNTVRSLDEQIAKWNANESVGVGGEEIFAAFLAEFGGRDLNPDDQTVDAMASWLRSFQPSKRASLAAPGLTLHGRANAIDFQVMKDGAIHAGADVKQLETVWRAEGWDQKLKASMDAVGPSFSGPLSNPDEPWHYDYLVQSVSPY